MERSMKQFKEIREQQYPEVRKHLKKIGKDSNVSYTDMRTKSKKTGRYGGLMRMGAHTYAKVHHDDHMAAVPLPQIHHK